jgi:hypothetical protein
MLSSAKTVTKPATPSAAQLDFKRFGERHFERSRNFLQDLDGRIRTPVLNPG